MPDFAEAVSLTSPNSTLVIDTLDPNVLTADLNLATANTWSAAQTFPPSGVIIQSSGGGQVTLAIGSVASDYTATFPAASGTLAIVSHAATWTALQTFGTEISFLGAQVSGTPSSGNVLYYNGSNWIPQAPSGLGLVNSVSNSDSTLTVSPTTGSVVASLNLANANTWTATQTLSNSGGGATGLSLVSTASSGSSVYSPVIAFYNDTHFEWMIRAGYATANTVTTAQDFIQFIWNASPYPALTLYGSGAVTTAKNTLDDGSGNITVNGAQAIAGSNYLALNPAASTSGTTYENSGAFRLLGSYWNGSASIPYGFQIVSINTATPSATLYFELDNNGTTTSLMTLASSGAVNFTGELTLTAAAATSGTTTVSSPQTEWIGTYWNGSASELVRFYQYVSSDSVSPTYALRWADFTSGTTIYAMALSSTESVATNASYTLYIHATSTVSDARLKPDFGDYAGDVLDELRAVRFGQHRLLANADRTTTDYGVPRAAVDARSLPDSVRQDRDDGYAAVLSPFYEHWITGAMRALLGEVDRLRERVRELEAAP
ncbi:MAG TPA: hypothetical protein VMG99_09050 [Thermoplasmata archaeon]|nr:hypothetical protein [Thermoplasmata archaeon]